MAKVAIKSKHLHEGLKGLVLRVVRPMEIKTGEIKDVFRSPNGISFHIDNVRINLEEKEGKRTIHIYWQGKHIAVPIRGHIHNHALGEGEEWLKGAVCRLLFGKAEERDQRELKRVLEKGLYKELCLITEIGSIRLNAQDLLHILKSAYGPAEKES